jgi:hypothetical protein
MLSSDEFEIRPRKNVALFLARLSKHLHQRIKQLQRLKKLEFKRFRDEEIGVSLLQLRFIIET